MSDVQPAPVFEASESIANLAEALAKAQGAMGGATKESQNTYFKNKYADLASICRAIKEPLAANGLSVVQVPGSPRLLPTEEVTVQEKGQPVVKTIHPCEVVLHSRLLHATGEWIGGTLSMRSDHSSAQAIGSCLTYARRYALAALVGVAPEDDDCEAAMGHRGSARQPANKPNGTTRGNGTQKPPATPKTQEQLIVAGAAFVSASESFNDLAKFADHGAMTIEDELKRGELQNQINVRLAIVLKAEIAKADAARLEEITEWLNGRVMAPEHAKDIIELTANRTEELTSAATTT